jgi:hypothetical protein
MVLVDTLVPDAYKTERGGVLRLSINDDAFHGSIDAVTPMQPPRRVEAGLRNVLRGARLFVKRDG